MRCAEVNDPHNAFTMSCKVWQIKKQSVQVYAERLDALANDAFVKVDKAGVESQLGGFFIDWLYNDFLCMKVMTENPWTFQAAVQSALTEVEKEISIKVKWPWQPKGQNWGTDGNRSHKTSKKMFLISQGEHLGKHCKSRSDQKQVRFSVGNVEKWVNWKETAQRTVDTNISNALETRLTTKVNKSRTRETSTFKPCISQWEE